MCVFLGLILLCAKPLGAYMAHVFEGQRTFLHPVLRWLEVLTYKVSGVREDVEQRWTQYTASLLSFTFFGFLLIYLLQRLQGFLPLNPQHFGASLVPPDLAFNTAVSFITNTNWQAYGGESTLSYFVQMTALTVQNFASAAAGIAVAVALIRGFARQERRTIGNFWVDMTRATVYVLLPICVILGLFLVSRGVIQNLNGYTAATTVEGVKQTIAQGPVASQEVIKQLGTNGGGFFNANSGHPFENPTPFTNLLSMFMIFLIPGALTYTFGKMVGDTRQGWAILGAFCVMFLAGVGRLLLVRARRQSQSGEAGPANSGDLRPAGGKHGGQGGPQRHCRFGSLHHSHNGCQLRRGQCLARQLHTSRRAGAAVQHDDRRGDFRRRRRGIIWDSAVLHSGGFHSRPDGGAHTGVSREEDRAERSQDGDAGGAGCRLQRPGIQRISSAINLPAKGYWNPPGAAIANLTNNGPHGLSEILYAYASATGNNGSAFGGLTANTPVV